MEGRPEERVGARVVSEGGGCGEEPRSDRCPLYIIQPQNQLLSLCMLLGLMKLPRQSLHVIATLPALLPPYSYGPTLEGVCAGAAGSCRKTRPAPITAMRSRSHYAPAPASSPASPTTTTTATAAGQVASPLLDVTEQGSASSARRKTARTRSKRGDDPVKRWSRRAWWWPVCP